VPPPTLLHARSTGHRSLLLSLALLANISNLSCYGIAPFPKDGNVILITVDTLRADHLGCYGYEAIRTPVIDRLAAGGVRFRQAYAQSNITIPSHISILTGLYVKDHGVSKNARSRLPRDIVNLGEVLEAAGFRTVAVTSNRILGPRIIRGIQRGFDAFYSPSEPERRAEATNRAFFRWLKKHHHRRFFAWVHYFDPHMPYTPPPPYQALYYQDDPRDPRFASMPDLAFPRAWLDPKSPSHRLITWLDGVQDFRYVVSQYDGEISYTDAMIGELLSQLEAFGLARKTLVIVTADHGESLDEHGIHMRHVALYEPVVRVPLIFWAPAVLRRPRVVDALVTSVDIMPTVLDILDMPGPSGQMKGQTLLPLMAGLPDDGRHFVHAEHMDRSQVMVRSADWKYIETLKRTSISDGFVLAKGQQELYDLANDPSETVNLSGTHPMRVREFEDEIVRWRGSDAASLPSGSGQPTEIPDYLKALGYVE